MTPGDILAASGALGMVATGVALLAAFGRDPHASEHSVDDYRPDPAATLTAEPEPRRRLRTESPMWLGKGVTVLPADLYGPIDPRDLEPAPIWEQMTARQWLRELAAEAREVAA